MVPVLTARRSIETPLGRLWLMADGGAITGLGWGGPPAGETCAPLVDAERQIAAYFAHSRKTFDLPLRVEGSAFQRAVCEAMLAIPYGETVTYGDIASQLKASAQAVGTACGGNPIPILIPCHRVLGVRTLGGYSGAGGIETKVALLRLEGAAGLLI